VLPEAAKNAGSKAVRIIQGCHQTNRIGSMPLPIRKANSTPEGLRRIAFENFELRLREGELRKNGSRIRLQAQPFRLLVLLLENAGEVVTREEICRELWPDNTFVDFEHGLAAAIKKIRDAIGDSAEDPKYIETLPKRGYRFIAKINPEAPEVLPVVLSHEAGRPAAMSGKAGGYRLWLLVSTITAAALAAGVVLVINRRAPAPAKPEAMIAVPFTSYPGVETAPSFSPDGSLIAFAWDKTTDGSSASPQFDLYVKGSRSETVLRLTHHPAAWISSTWSPDGTQIAFHRMAPDDNGIYVVPALGGPERKLVATAIPYSVAAPISWSPDGKWLAYADTENGKPGDRIFLLNVNTLEIRKFPHDPSCNHEGLATFSHSGGQLATICVHSTNSFEYFVANLDGTARRSVVTIREWAIGLVWKADDKALILPRQTASGTEFDSYAVEDGSMTKLEVQAGDWPAISRDGHKLAFSLPASHVNIWRRDLLHPKAPGEQLFTSTLQQNNARYSPDGKHVAFASTRSGVWSIWLAGTDGNDLVQVSHDRAAGFPRWSPDSKSIVFEMEEANGLFGVYTAAVDDRVPHKLETDIKGVNRPSWSSDGKWIYFRAYEGVGQQLYRCPAPGGTANLLLAAQDPISPVESADGTTLYFPERNLNARIMMLGLGPERGEPRPVPEMPRILTETQWTLAANGIYFVAHGSPRAVSFYDFATRKTRIVFHSERELDDGLSLSPDGRYLLYSQLDENNSLVMLVDRFH
jgi:Tol biopolymer transport system component/DNA-binding winged helix-turn-helix (wHTH) protein